MYVYCIFISQSSDIITGHIYIMILQAYTKLLISFLIPFQVGATSFKLRIVIKVTAGSVQRCKFPDDCGME